MSKLRRESRGQASEQLLVAQNLVLEMIALGSPLEEILGAVQSFIARLAPGSMCNIFLLGSDGCTLQRGAALMGPFKGALGQIPVGPKNGVIGATAYRRERVIVPDTVTAPLYEEYRKLTLSWGLRSCWGTPVLSSNGSLLGVVGVYYTRPHIPPDQEIAAVETATALVRIAVERSGFKAGLQAGKERFQALIENTSDVISILDRKGIIQYLTPSVERVLGFESSDLTGVSWFSCLHPDDLRRAHRVFERWLEQSGPCFPVEQRFRHKNDTWRVLETIANNQVTDPIIGGLIVTAHDVTDRKLMEDKLISSRNNYYELFENANDIIYTHDLAGTLTSFNKAAERLTGYSRAEALSKNIAEIIAPEFKELRREMTERKMGGEASTTYELVFIGKRGARVLLEVTTRLIFQRGKPIAVQGVARDITRRRDLEAHLLQTQKMEAIGRLAGGIAHDFNNMLTVITGYGEWLLEQIPASSPLVENASEILLAANRAAALTSQLLSFSRKQIIQPVILDLNALVSRLDPMLHRLIGDDVELVVATSPELGLIRADPGQIEQVVMNLVVNARDAMPAGGKLTIETANAIDGSEFDCTCIDRPPGDCVVLSVRDTGSGIDERIMPHIFEPFFTTKVQGKGTGLGLSTVYGIVKQDGGCVQVYNDPNGGAVFRVYLPTVVGATSRPFIPFERRIGGSETILLVEDEASVRRAVGDMLRPLGYTVLAFPASDLALKFVAESPEPIQLLLTDVVMPQLGGRELARQLKAFRRDLKVLYMSGHVGDATSLEDLSGEGAAYLPKPFTRDALAARVRALLDAPPPTAPAAG